jgi:hypothetical protein
VLLCSCSTAHHGTPAAGKAFVGKVDISKAPQLQELAGQARTFGNEMYPKICALLLDETAKPPQQFDLILKPLKSRNTGEAHLEVKRIYLNSDYLTNRAELREHFEKVFVHEMAHMAVQYRHWTASLWRSAPPASGYWGESIADYAFYKLIGTNGWSCPECNLLFPHYTSGYTCGGAFLLYLDASYGTNLVLQLVRELRQRSYSDAFFTRATGKSLDALWAEFQTTPTFKPGARQAQELRLALGYTNGQAPRNVLARFDKFVEQHADTFTQKAIRAARQQGKLSDIRVLFTLYFYLTQPGGSGEGFIYDLRETGRLPGIAKGEKSWIYKMVEFEEMKSIDFPVVRTTDCRKAGDNSTYHYAVSRTSQESDWKLEKAWRTAPDGKVIEEYRLP